jgi:hypothetical protein
MRLAEKLAEEWRSRLAAELPNHSLVVREAIVQWLIGEDPDRYDQLSPSLQKITGDAIDYRYRILRQRYLDTPPEKAYKQLIQRLSAPYLIRSKIRTWISLSRDRQQSVLNVIEEVVQELLRSDTYLQQQTIWIAKCSPNNRLRDALALATVEEYCLRPIRNQPLLTYRFVNYLRRSQRGGMTQVPAEEFIRLVSEEIAPDDSEGSVSLLDSEAVAQYQAAQAELETQELREAVQQRFETYLEKNLNSTAVEWLRLYLQGNSQEAIAKALDLKIKDVYRLREKVTYHAVRVFANKTQPELVNAWIGNKSPS